MFQPSAHLLLTVPLHKNKDDCFWQTAALYRMAEMEQHEKEPDTTQAQAPYYGTARMQQMSGGTTADSEPTAPDADGPYGAARIAQLHGVGSDTTPATPLQDDNATE